MKPAQHINRPPTLALAAMVTGILAAAPLHAAIEVTPDHVVSGSPTGTLVAIDVPFMTTYPTVGGPDWTTSPPAGVTAHVGRQRLCDRQ